MPRYLSLLFVLITLGGCASVERLAIPDSNLIRTDLAQSGQQDTIDHAQWDQFLQRYTAQDAKGVVRVDYGGVNKVDHQGLKNYINALSDVDPSALSKDAQLAYWANLYNAKTVDVILDHYPVDSIREIKNGFFDLGPWEDKRLSLRGQPTSLHDIEHGIVRPLWSDTPEIHYILNCAAVGCPNLSQKAFTADNIQHIMRRSAIAYVNNPYRGVIVDENGNITLSKIYSWYRDDFGGSDRAVLNHLRSYAAPDLREELNGKTVIDNYTYDWSLNDGAKRR